MPTENYEIVGSYNNQRVLPIDAERSVNLFEFLDANGKKQKALLPTSGLQNTGVSFAPTTGGFRASFIFSGISYHVIGNSFWKVQRIGDALVPTLLNNGLGPNFGPLTTSTGYVGIDANTFQIIIVDGSHGYIYDTTTNVFVQITDPAFPTLPTDVTTLDNFFVVIQDGTPNFELSELNQGLVWGPDHTSGTGNAFVATSGSSPNLVLSAGTTANYQVGTPITFDTTGGGVLPVPTTGALLNTTTTYYVQSVVNATTFTISRTNGGSALLFNTAGSGTIFVTNNGQLQLASITTHPGTLVACRTLHRRLFLFSQFYTEIWENAGLGTNLPFRRNNSILMEFGCAAIGSVAVDFDKMFFLSQDRGGLGPVMEVVGTESAPVSTKALDFQLNTYANMQKISDCRAFLIRDNGIIFYRMNFTEANHTFVYDVTQSNPQIEAQRLWHEEETLAGNRHPAQTHVFLSGENYVGHYALPIFYDIDVDFNDNDGEDIRRMRIGRAYCPPGYQRIRIDRFQLDLLQGQIQDVHFDNVPILTENSLDILTESGDPLLTDQLMLINEVIDPSCWLSYSKDGGQTYGIRIPGPMGNDGDRIFRTVWRKLGTTVRGQSFVPKIEFFFPLPFVIMGAAWSYEILPE